MTLEKNCRKIAVSKDSTDVALEQAASLTRNHRTMDLIAKHPNTPEKVLSGFLSDYEFAFPLVVNPHPDPSIFLIISRHPNASKHLLCRLVELANCLNQDTYGEFRTRLMKSIIRHPNTTEDMLLELSFHKDHEVSICAARALKRRIAKPCTF